MLGSDIDRRVIVIDDNPDIFADFQLILDRQPAVEPVHDLEAKIFAADDATSSSVAVAETTYTLSFARQGQEGVTQVRQALDAGQPYQVAFVDMRMPPGWDGLETTERLWDLDPNLQIVICTAYSDYSWNEITTRLQSHGENLLILKKPFDQAEVAQLAVSLTRKWWLAHQANMKLEELEQMVANQTNKIAEARSMAERTEKAKSDFVQGMCLKIHPNLESILEFCDEISGESVRKIRMEHLQRIRTTSKNLLTVIEDLLAVSRMDVTEETE